MKISHLPSLLAAAGAFALPALQPLSPPAFSADAPMLTPWAADAQAGRGWLEYPRPQMTRDTWQNLNGQWDYAITPLGSPAPEKYDGQIRVPYCVESTLSGVAREFKPDQRLWYRRAFTIPANWDGQRVLLHFGAVDYECHVYVNGAPAGSHTGGFAPFSFDITPHLKKDGAAQEIIVSVTDPTSDGDQPRGKQRLEQSGIWYTPVSGIWQTVWLEPVPAEMSIESIKCEPDLDGQFLKLTAMGNRIAHGEAHYAIRARVLDAGKLVAEASGRLNRELVIPIANPKTWCPANPHLYDLQIDLLGVESPFKAAAKTDPKTGKATPPKGRAPVKYFGPEEQAFYAKIPSGSRQLDSVKSYFAMRKISLGQGPKGVVILLNNKPLFQLGPLDQGYWPDGLLTPPTEAAMRFDLDFLKKAGFNMLRKHIKVEPALYYAHCDKIGLLVWQDMPSGMAERDHVHGEDRQHVLRNDSGEIKRLPQSAAQFELELRRMIDALHAFPCIVLWVPFNEGWGQYDTDRIGKWVKQYDPSRLVNNVTGWRHTDGGDILAHHNYNEKLPADTLVRRDARRALVLGEFGGVGYPIEGHLWWTNKRNWGYQTYHSAADLEKHYRNRLGQLRDMANATGMCAGVYTQTTDVEGEVNGLLTYDRKVEKIPAAKLREIHRALELYSIPDSEQ